MNTKKPITELFISVGSNIEPRIHHLQQAIFLIKKAAIEITSYSSVYETPAWGFVSTPFYNACIGIKTKLKTKETLIELQKIEKMIGRKQKKSDTYEARAIDLDILYSSEGIFNYNTLVVPHPLLQDRVFVLQPLIDIAPKYKHPLLHKTTENLLQITSDISKIEQTSLKLN